MDRKRPPLNDKIKHISVEKALLLFYAISAVVIFVVVTISTWFSVQTMLRKEHLELTRHQQQEVKHSILTFLEQRHTVLRDYAAFPVLTQGVMQPETNLANLADLFNGLTLLGSHAELTLLDYSGRGSDFQTR